MILLVCKYSFPILAKVDVTTCVGEVRRHTKRKRERGEEKGTKRENSIFDLVSTYFVISCVDRDESIVRT